MTEEQTERVIDLLVAIDAKLQRLIPPMSPLLYNGMPQTPGMSPYRDPFCVGDVSSHYEGTMGETK